MSRMAKANDCKLTFDCNSCHVQDIITLKMIGTVRLKDGLYILNSMARASFTFHILNAIDSSKNCIWQLAYEIRALFK